jgi:uncharacterized small protein (DUF1192 family)
MSDNPIKDVCDEIDSLDTDNIRLRQRIASLTEEVERLRAENARLKVERGERQGSQSDA